jgi:hypothetical protein
MFTNIIRALLGGLGVIKKTKKFTTKNNYEFLRKLSPASIVLTAARDPNFIQGGIQGATNSFWQHALLYVGKTAGTIVRQMYPKLLLNREISLEAKEHEIIEAQGEGIIISKLDKDLGDNTQMVAYIRPITTIELMKILFRMYSNIGKPYDFLEFIGDAFPGIPISNPDDLFVCSSAVADAWLPVERIAKTSVDVRRTTPADLNNYLSSKLKWNQTRYNW